jgi:hypothetical protein
MSAQFMPLRLGWCEWHWNSIDPQGGKTIRQKRILEEIMHQQGTIIVLFLLLHYISLYITVT